MSEYSPRPKAGYTRTGKSLKAVRRYYALKNAEKERQRSPRKGREDDDRHLKRNPADDKLSKRIAVELKHQAAANEKRSLRSPNAQKDAQSPDTPIIVSPKETGPVFIAEQPNKSAKSVKSVKSAKSAKSSKSVRSHRSTGTVAAQRPVGHHESGSIEFGPLSLGCVLASCLIGLVYVFNWILMFTFDRLKESHLNKTDCTGQASDLLPRALYLGVVSLVVISNGMYWLNYRFGFKQAIISTVLMLGSTLCVGAYIVYTSVTKVDGEGSFPNPGHKTTTRIELEHILFLLAISYIVVLSISTGMMVKQVMTLNASKSTDHKNNHREVPQMSYFLAPH